MPSKRFIDYSFHRLTPLKGIVFWILFGLLAAITARAQQIHPGHTLHHDPDLQHDSSLSLNGLWESKYISEGRNNLDEGGLGSAALEWTSPVGPNELVIAGWYAEGIEADYSELQLGLGYVIASDTVNVSLGYTWLDFARDNVSDNELSIELGFNALDLVDITSVIVYSTEAGGTFVELIASREISKDNLTITPYALLGINDGYVSDEHKGLNNFQVGLEGAIILSEGLDFEWFASFTTPLDKRHGESLNDYFWAGVGLTISR